MESLGILAGLLRKEAKNIFESSGDIVSVVSNPDCLILNYKHKSITIRDYPRHNLVQWNMSTGRGGYVRANSPAEAAIDLLQTLYRC